MTDILNREDIKIMINAFYKSVREDAILAPVFNPIVGDNWDKHLATMYNFWQTVLLHEFSYKGSPFAPHRKLPIDQEHFDRWLLIFNTSLDRNFKGPVAEDAKWRARKMAQMFMYKLNGKNY